MNVISAHHRFCICSPEQRDHVHLGNAGFSTDGETIDHFYCRTCNSTWKELGGPLEEIKEEETLEQWKSNLFEQFREVPRASDLMYV